MPPKDADRSTKNVDPDDHTFGVVYVSTLFAEVYMYLSKKTKDSLLIVNVVISTEDMSMLKQDGSEVQFTGPSSVFENWYGH